MTKLFISQPMRGKSDEEILAERERAIVAAKSFIDGEVVVLNSFFEDFNAIKPEMGDVMNEPLAYLAKSLEFLAQAHVAYFCEGWQDARGCRIEYTCAKDYGILIIDGTSEKSDIRDPLEIPDSEFDVYIGTKVVGAIPGRIQADSQDGYIIRYPDGYTSWSPTDVFEESYRRATCLNFGIALEMCRKGAKIARDGWNGKGLFVVYQPGYPEGIACNKNTANAWGMKEGDLFKCDPYLQINTVDGSHAMWVPSIRDCLADDWTIVMEDSEK